jgi:hypothetical protein
MYCFDAISKEIMHKINVDIHKNQIKTTTGCNVTDNGNSNEFAVEEHRGQVASMLVQPTTETEIDSQLGVDQL